MHFAHLFHKDLMQARLAQLKGNQRDPLRNQRFQQLVRLCLSGHPALIGKADTGENRHACGFDQFFQILFRLDEQIDPAVALFNLRQIALQNGLAAAEDCQVRAKFLDRRHLVARHDEIFALADLLVDNALEDIDDLAAMALAAQGE